MRIKLELFFNAQDLKEKMLITMSLWLTPIASQTIFLDMLSQAEKGNRVCYK